MVKLNMYQMYENSHQLKKIEDICSYINYLNIHCNISELKATLLYLKNYHLNQIHELIQRSDVNDMQKLKGLITIIS